MGLHKLFSAMAIAGLVSGVAQAAPITFTFDPTGTPGAAGDITGVGIIDLAPGNVLAINGGVPQMLAGGLGHKVTDLYSANLGSMQAPDTTNLYSNGTGGTFFTVAAGYGEQILALAGCPGVGCTAVFGFDPTNPINFIELNVNGVLGSNLGGTGFTTGLNILTGHIVQIATNFTVTGGGAGTPLDQSPNGNQWGAIDTLTGIGGGNIVFMVDTVHADYFPTLNPGSEITLGFLNASLIDPFNQVDPSNFFSDSPILDGNIAANIGAINGISGPNFMFQADTNASLVVPEPASLALLGLGLAGLGFSRRRQAF